MCRLRPSQQREGQIAREHRDSVGPNVRRTSRLVHSAICHLPCRGIAPVLFSSCTHPLAPAQSPKGRSKSQRVLAGMGCVSSKIGFNQELGSVDFSTFVSRGRLEHDRDITRNQRAKGNWNSIPRRRYCCGSHGVLLWHAYLYRPIRLRILLRGSATALQVATTPKGLKVDVKSR